MSILFEPPPTLLPDRLLERRAVAAAIEDRAEAWVPDPDPDGAGARESDDESKTVITIEQPDQADSAYDSMTLKELKEEARKKGVSIKNKNKQQILQELEEFEE